MIDPFTAPTPNGWKASVTLEELELPYETHFVNIAEGAQNALDFRAINPNGRIPAIVDRDAGDFAVFESGAIMIYLAERPVGCYRRISKAGRGSSSGSCSRWAVWVP